VEAAGEDVLHISSWRTDRREVGWVCRTRGRECVGATATARAGAAAKKRVCAPYQIKRLVCKKKRHVISITDISAKCHHVQHSGVPSNVHVTCSVDRAWAPG
jgi:hypothetical protein